jgi:hypothetical protein
VGVGSFVGFGVASVLAAGAAVLGGAVGDDATLDGPSDERESLPHAPTIVAGSAISQRSTTMKFG